MGDHETIGLPPEEDLNTKKEWKKLAKGALDIQDACNLSGVVISFSKVIIEVRRLLEAEGKLSTDEVNNHPVCVLYADKIAHLTGTQYIGHGKVMWAYKWAHDVV